MENKFSLQVLISTMHQKDYSLLDKMNIQSDTIVVNQCNRNEICDFIYKGNKIKWMNLAERGVGLSRNTALMRATADILLFADDDVVYNDNYAELVINEFEKYKKASLIVFNLESLNPERAESIVKKNYKLTYFNCMKFGAFRIACKREDIIKNNIYYSLLFGGGAKYQAGEDNLFIINILNNGLQGYANSKMIGTVAQQESTWFKGLNEKYYYDKGCLFKAMFGKYAKIMFFLSQIKNKNNDIPFIQTINYGFKGINEYEIIKNNNRNK